ncbi:MAG: N-acetylmuramoyl-L-alanine amidase, partial [Alphaproteobacteria bacterium]
MIERPSPNHEARSPDIPIDILLLHYTGMETAEGALERLCDPAAKVSAHYTIDEDGTLYRHVGEDRRAWHAGKSFWAGSYDINGRSIGIELVNPGHEFGYRAFPEAQMAALIELAGGILARHPIPPHRVLGHSDVAPGRKQDPGELFDWARLADAGIGLWPGEAAEEDGMPIAAIQMLLARIGYEVAGTNALD